MECGRWLLGIDIQPHQLIAVALVRRRDGDQLRGWWHFPLRGGYAYAIPRRSPAGLIGIACAPAAPSVGANGVSRRAGYLPYAAGDSPALTPTATNVVAGSE